MPDAAESIRIARGVYVVQPGDSMSSIAAASGHFWMTLWQAPENSALKETRTSPEILNPGDEVVVPPLEITSETCASGRVHRFRRRGVPIQVLCEVKAPDGTTFAGKRFALEVGTHRYEGKTDGLGRVSAWVAPAVKTGMLTVWPDEPGFPSTVVWKLRIGGVDPADTISGVQARLNNLGFDCGPEDGAMSPRMEAALKAFQQAHSLEPTGAVDSRTRERLRQIHGS